MASAVKLGVEESAHGTIASTLVSVPCNFIARSRQANKVLDEDRQGQDRNFAMQQGFAHEEFEVTDSVIYHDSFGFWLASGLGTPAQAASAGETAVWDYTYKFTDDPDSLSLQWQQPRRYTQAYQSLWAVVDEIEVSFEAEGDLTYSLSGVAMHESEITQITHSFTTSRPFAAWAGTVTVGGAGTANLVSGTVSIKRNRNPFFTINNQQDPSKMSIGARTVAFDLVMDFVTKAEYDKYKAATTQDVGINWVDAGTDLGVATTNPAFGIAMGTTGYTEAEVDTDSDLPMLNLTGTALYDASDASLAVLTLTSDRDYLA